MLIHHFEADTHIETFICRSFNGTNILYHKTDLCGDYSLLSWHGLCPIYSRFVVNRILSPICAFWVCFVQTFLGFDSDFTQISRPKIGG